MYCTCQCWKWHQLASVTCPKKCPSFIGTRSECESAECIRDGMSSSFFVSNLCQKTFFLYREINILHKPISLTKCSFASSPIFGELKMLPRFQYLQGCQMINWVASLCLEFQRGLDNTLLQPSCLLFFFHFYQYHGSLFLCDIQGRKSMFKHGGGGGNIGLKYTCWLRDVSHAPPRKLF